MERGIERREGRPGRRTTRPACVLYRPRRRQARNAGNIALKYNTSTEAIISANSIECDELEQDTILLIPSI